MSVCVTTSVSGDYQHYIPLFAYCVKSAYPDYHVKVFLTDPCGDALREAATWLPNLEIVSGEFKNYEHHPPRWAAWTRYLLFTDRRVHHWEPFDWVYITDADLMIVRQEPPLHEQHIQHMKTLGLCYSNMLRDPRRFADKHLTGLHFCGQEFIRKVQAKCTEYDGLVRVNGGGVLDGKPVIYDERLLYQIVRDAGLDFPPYMSDDYDDPSNPANYRNAHFRPWHGINIGRAMVPNWHKDFVRAKLPWFQKVVKEFVSMADDPLFWRMHGMLSLKAHWALYDIIKATEQELREPEWTA